MNTRHLGIQLFAVIVGLTWMQVYAADFVTVRRAIQEGRIDEAREVISAVIDAPTASSEQKAEAYICVGMIAESEQKPLSELIVIYQKALEFAKGVLIGEASYRLAKVYSKDKSYDRAKALFDRVYTGEIPSTKQVRAEATYEYGIFMSSKLKDHEKAKDILLALDTGLVPSEGTIQQDARYTLGPV